MNDEQQKLKLRLKFKSTNKILNELVNWNFGYCPTRDRVFDKALEMRIDILEAAKYCYPRFVR